MTKEIMITIEDKQVPLSDLQNDVSGAIRKGYGHEFAFRWHTVQGLIDKINELTAKEEIVVKELTPSTMLKAVFPNGDELVLTLKACDFAGYEPKEIFELTYGERYEGNYGDDVPTEGEYHFMTTQTEYFPKNAQETAVSAFTQRAQSENPAMATDLGFHLLTF